jgi:hypothetical protein
MPEKETVYIDKDLEQLIPDYLDNRRNDAVRIREALQNEDFEAIRIIGHNMKGTGGGYGFDALTLKGGEIQAAALRRESIALLRLSDELLDYIGGIEIVYV